jgi:hypothetical protein
MEIIDPTGGLNHNIKEGNTGGRRNRKCPG